jgi:hypothetical protein
MKKKWSIYNVIVREECSSSVRVRVCMILNYSNSTLLNKSHQEIGIICQPS